MEITLFFADWSIIMSKTPNKGSAPKHVRDNRANQLNPQHPAYHQSRGSSPKSAQKMQTLTSSKK